MWSSYPMRKTKRDQVDVRHQRAMDIADQDVTVVSATQWQVNSQGGAGRGAYNIYLENASCPRGSCRETQKCYASGCGGLCEHMYRCTCPDNNTMCKHVHKVRIMSVRSTQTADQRAATSREDQRWRKEVDVDREVRRVRSILGEIRCYLDRYESDALQGVIGEAAEELAGISAKIFCHCEDYERREEYGEEEEEEVEEEEAEEGDAEEGDDDEGDDHGDGEDVNGDADDHGDGGDAVNGDGEVQVDGEGYMMDPGDGYYVYDDGDVLDDGGEGRVFDDIV
ncbi:uncharacterized protein LOC117649560 [Thrips palmi]|uniref:Uncharacterized protein LOC117649560 n=1 Tax=Thrips palmi TaxID=161013 RepID=A0A6P8ZTN1_THRPL|nr:uncharacterized protein LOC117649560 [Thrips palmi]XP_034248348.1 uncharacterized protein LOC117649560 [Thrips palmi]XP_034248355.1 uncharacterized protein LOC117649560 [Thrips palmi]XP_034248364.1 uncharacterized protein LOC117649560 [Thrips palmi]XP_034248371.1 uncharacterized protein LOC117649560 [Thrips palmi]XP_034248379.1 uncharacterized protein LOC117649560 [Thrips palmi]